MATEPELEAITEFDDEDTLEYAFVDNFDDDDFEDATWEWDGDSWKQVA